MANWFRGIDNVRAPGGGRIGLVRCPGTRPPTIHAAGPEASLARDLAELVDWGALALVTLVEAREMELLGVPNLGPGVREHGLEWFHLPTPDGLAPAASFEPVWQEVAPRLHAMLDADQRLVVHCRAGLGRSGCIAARLLIERGDEPDDAIRAVRRARHFAIETGDQWSWVQALPQRRPRGA